MASSVSATLLVPARLGLHRSGHTHFAPKTEISLTLGRNVLLPGLPACHQPHKRRPSIRTFQPSVRTARPTRPDETTRARLSFRFVPAWHEGAVNCYASPLCEAGQLTLLNPANEIRNIVQKITWQDPSGDGDPARPRNRSVICRTMFPYLTQGNRLSR